ncbi:MAG: protein kinase domain-containing protein [Prosthecobacter sp.]|uniref:WD40 repeat domain-containing serine/threonine protein kinase n=1 Tax=Prosthecobacter sp. TaxID=1965333 RepID=UPI0038FDF33F
MTTCPDCQHTFDPAQVPGGHCPRCRFMGGAHEAESLQAPLPDCEIVDLIAHGGMGDVYRATQPTLERELAVKVMTGHAATPELAARFRREALVLARLQHPNIVPIHALGTDEDGQPYYTMKLVKGRTLQAILDDLRQGEAATLRLHSLLSLLGAFRKVCDALAFAHAQGVLHRDLKPDNIMIGEFGEVLVMDWGLARMQDKETGRLGEEETSEPAFSQSPSLLVSASGLTLQGSVLGTPQYMSPEQAAGQVSELDERADIYSLGAVLYAILTLRPPVEGQTVQEVLEKVKTGSITSLAQGAGLAKSRLSPERHLASAAPWLIPASLSAVAMKALALDKAKRYPSVTALISDVEAYQGGFATGAENAGTWKQLMLLMRRHRTVTASLAVLLVLSAGFVFKLMSSEQRALNGEQSAKASAAVAVQEKEAARHSLATAQTSLAEAAFRDSNLVGMVKALDDCPADLRDQNWRYLSAKRDSSMGRLQVAGFEKIADAQAVPSQPNQFALLNQEGAIGFVDVVKRTLLRTVKTGVPTIHQLTFSGDGTRFMAFGESTALLFETASGTLIKTLRLDCDRVNEIALDRPGHQMAVSGFKRLPEEQRDHKLSVVDLATGATRWRFPEDDQGTELSNACFFSGGERVAVTDWNDKTLRVFQVSGGALVYEVHTPVPPQTLAPSPDGQRLALGLANGELRLLDATTGQELHRGQLYKGALQHVAWTRGNLLLTIGSERSFDDVEMVLRLWEPERLAPRGTFFGFEGLTFSLNAASGFLLTPESPRQRWLIPAGLELARQTFRTEQGWSCHFLSDTVLLARGDYYNLQRYDLTDPRQPKAIDAPFPVGFTISAVAAKAGLFALGNKGPELKLMSYDQSGVKERWQRVTPTRVRQLEFDANAEHLLANFGSKTQVLDAQTGELRLLIDRKLERAVFAGTQGHLVAIASITRVTEELEDQVVILDGRDGHERARFVSPFRLNALAVSPDRRLIAVAGDEQFVTVLDADTLAVKHRFRAHDASITALAFHPTQRILATGSADFTVKLWDYAEAQVQQTFMGLDGRPVMLDFSPNGQRLAVEGQEKSFRVYDVSDATVRPKGEVMAMAPEIAKKITAKAAETPATPPASADGRDRNAMFDRIDKEKLGKVTREVFISRQSDAAASNERFDRFDVNKDGFMSREEYVKMGK